MVGIGAVLMMVGCSAGTDSGYLDHHAVEYTTSATTSGGSFLVSYTTDPDPAPSLEYFAVTASVFDADDTAAPVIGAVVDMDASMPSHGHGMNVVPTISDNGDGTYTGAPFLLHMTGDWLLTFAVSHDGVTETAEMYFGCCEY